MILLSFTVRNHGSIRDEVTLELTRPSLKTLTPNGRSWHSETYPLAGIFGANATGKSAMLDALIYAFSAIKLSSSTWLAHKSMPRNPFKLDGTHSESTSTYDLEFVVRDRRYNYGFEVDAKGVCAEWLRDIPKSRWRTLLYRERGEGDPKFSSAAMPRIEVTERELALSRALLLPSHSLHQIARALVTSFDAVLVADSHREARLQEITTSLAEGHIDFADLTHLLQVADIGVEKVEIEEGESKDDLLRVLRRVVKEMQAEEGEDSEDLPALDEDQLARLARYLVFTHRGSSRNVPRFSINEESNGTIAWLALAVPALTTLRKGGVLAVDELDASLHPHLLEALLAAFADNHINTRHAQLIFTTHESYLLSPLSSVELEPEQVWFTDKTTDGATELTCLADFPKHKDANVAKRYLTGRYAGVPRLSPGTFTALVHSGE